MWEAAEASAERGRDERGARRRTCREEKPLKRRSWIDRNQDMVLEQGRMAARNVGGSLA